jgi:WD40 repeat protein
MRTKEENFISLTLEIFSFVFISQTLKELNTINSLQYSQYNRDVFLSGARDGYVKIWDAYVVLFLSTISNCLRTHWINTNFGDERIRRMIGYNDNNNKAVITFQAHTAKLNCASWSYNDCFVCWSVGS